MRSFNSTSHHILYEDSYMKEQNQETLSKIAVLLSLALSARGGRGDRRAGRLTRVLIVMKV